MLSNQVVTSEEIPSPYVSLPRLTALVRYSKICQGAVHYSVSHMRLSESWSQCVLRVDLSFITFVTI